MGRALGMGLVLNGTIEEDFVGFGVVVDEERGDGSDLGDGGEGVGGWVADRVGGDDEGAARTSGDGGGGESEEDESDGGDWETEEERSHGGERLKFEEIFFFSGI